MKLALKAGTTSKILTVFIQNSSSTTGAGLTGLAYNTGSLTAYYYREGAGSATAISLVTATAGTFTSGGFVVVDGTNLPGVYELHIPNAAIASGAASVVVMLKGAANMAPLVLEIQLTAVDLADGTRGGMTALPNAVPGGSGGLIVLGNSGNTARLDLTAGMIISQSTTNAPGLSISGNGSGQGVLVAAGNAAAGVHITADSGSGVLISASTSGHGIEVTGYGSGKSAIKLQGASSGVAEIAGNLAGTITGLTAAGWAGAFLIDSGEAYGDAVAGSVVAEIADNAAGSGLDAAGVRSAIGLSSANLDTQLAAIDDAVDTEVGAIKSVTDKLDPMIISAGTGDYQFDTTALANAPTGSGSGLDAAGVRAAVGLASANLDTQLGGLAQPGDEMDLVDAPNATALTAIATAVWAIATSALTTVGSVGAYVVARLGYLYSGVPVQIVSPVTTTGDLELIQGSAYDTAQNNAITFSVPTADVDLTGQTPTLTLTATTGDNHLAVTGTVTDAGTADQAIVFELTASQTAGLDADPAAANTYTAAKTAYTYTVGFSGSGKPCAKRIRGKASVIADEAACTT